MASVYARSKRQDGRPLADDTVGLAGPEGHRSGPNPSQADLSVQVTQLRSRARAAVLRESDPVRARLLVSAVERLAKVACAASLLLLTGCPLPERIDSIHRPETAQLLVACARTCPVPMRPLLVDTNRGGFRTVWSCACLPPVEAVR